MYLLKLIILSLITSFTLTACSSNPLIDSDTQAVKKFILEKDVQIAANSARGYFQNSTYLGSAGFNQFSQHCRLEIKTLMTEPQTIEADHFTVTSITADEEMIAQSNNPVQLAMLTSRYDSGVLVALLGQQNRVETMDLIHLNLTSKNQPDVMRLTCAGSLSNGSLMDDPFSHRPDKKVINQILGEYGRVE